MAIPGLLPCPFCGNTRVCMRSVPFMVAYLVECPSCKARGPERHIIHGENTSKTAECENAKRRAADAWNSNRRTPEVIKAWMESEDVPTDE